MNIEDQYLDLMQHILKNGDERIDRTGIGTRSVFGVTMRMDLSGGVFPALTTKRVYWKTAVREMLWFLTGNTNIRELLVNNVRIWSEWPHKKYQESTGDKIDIREFEKRILEDENFAQKWGDLGPVYGKQWRQWEGSDGEHYDQIEDVINALKNNPASRRILFHGWNVPDLTNMALPPCHLLYQYHVSSDGKLNSIMYQRSCDLLLGNPFNLVGQATLQAMLAQQAGLEVGELVWMGGDVHIYLNHLEQVEEQLSRTPGQLPRLEISNRALSIDDYKIEDFKVIGYNPQEAIKAPVAV